MTLIDAGPLIALIDTSDKETHHKCLTAFQAIKTIPLTTWPCVAEAMYLLGQINGWPAQQMLLGLLLGGAIEIHHSTERENEFGNNRSDDRVSCIALAAAGAALCGADVFQTA